MSSNNPKPVRVGSLVLINERASYFQGRYAHVAYIGNDGVSGYLQDEPDDMLADLCLPMKWEEFDLVTAPAKELKRALRIEEEP